MKPSVKYRVIYRHKDKYSISEMCRFFGVSRSGYYDFVARMEIPDNQRIQFKTKLVPSEKRNQFVA